ncbi:hypothetical protein QN277_021422 [Acacia crassicarpa]|uniref:Uncharacterized protein n=1 Tax=Acacia crassicarpa TaxID=499986 RepID=A0AAE1MPF3_9FABA|nr:hypothetical protein QN277_021422 [Acacia crassicarpa]
MSWVRSAVNKAAEVGGKSNLSRTVRSYADSVVLHASNAVAGGAKIIQERMGNRNMQSFKLTVKRLEEVSVSYRGAERVQLLRRWLVALKEIERLAGFSELNANDPEDPLFADEYKDSPTRPTPVYYADPGMKGEPRNFRHVFLSSQALEGMTLSMILEAPSEEEVPLLSELYGLCLTGGKEEAAAVLSSVMDLAKVFSGYDDEVLAKREELLQIVQGALAGLKINAELVRIDDEAGCLKEQIEKMKGKKPDEDSIKSPKETPIVVIEDLDEAALQIRTCCKLEELLLQKKYFSYGDSPEFHAEKVDKLRVLAESLINSTSKAKSRISENRSQKEEVLSFRVIKSHEVNEVEKDLGEEVNELEKQKDELEANLKKVNASLASARMHLQNAKEEREQFEDASNEILAHLSMKEDELRRAIASYTNEADVVDTWINFLQSTWLLQTAHTEKKNEQVKADLEQYGDCFVNLVLQLLSSYKEKLGQSVTQVRKLVEDLSSSQGSEISAAGDNDVSKIMDSRKRIEEEYLDVESKFQSTLILADDIKKQFHIQIEGTFRKDHDKVKELLEAIEKIKDEFGSIERPKLEVETPTQRSETQPSQTSFKSASTETPSVANGVRPNELLKSLSFGGRMSESSVIQAQLDNICEDGSADEISEWEFDAKKN